MLAPDDVLQNRYRIVRRLGHGGMGAVYEAIDRRVKSTVAIKETFATTEKGRLAFRHEAERLANLDHEVFPKVSDYFEEGEGLYLVMQLIRGEDLEERLRERLRYHEGPFSPTKVLEWADQLLDALEELHKYNPPIIHRDIKPSNLKLNQRGKIILLDFGIAKGAAGQMSTLRTDGSIGGATPYFAPLEQVLRIDPSSVKTLSTISHESVERILSKGTDPRSDLYSLGATLYRLMTGEIPDDARLRAMAIWADRHDPLQPIHKVNSKVPQAVSDALMQAMALERNERPSDAATMRRMLCEAVSTPVHTPPTIPPPEELEHQRREAEARRRDEDETERLRREEEERQRAEEETRQREAEAQREREAQQEAARRAEEWQRQEAEEKRRAEEARAAEEARRKREAEAAEAARQAEAERRRKEEEAKQRAEEEERQRKEAEERERLEVEEAAKLAEEERLSREAEEAKRKRAAKDEERKLTAQQTATATAQRANESTPPDSSAVKTVKASPHVAANSGKDRYLILIGAIALFAIVIVVIVVLTRNGENNNRYEEPVRNTQSQTPAETDNINRAGASGNTGSVPPSNSNSATGTKHAQERDATERRKRALEILDQP